MSDHSQVSGIARRGFGSMDPKRQREIAAMGGRAVADEHRSFSKSKDLAASAGRKGGKAVPNDKRSFSTDPELASAAGKKGGKRSHSRSVARFAGTVV